MTSHTGADGLLWGGPYRGVRPPYDGPLPPRHGPMPCIMLAMYIPEGMCRASKIGSTAPGGGLWTAEFMMTDAALWLQRQQQMPQKYQAFISLLRQRTMYHSMLLYYLLCTGVIDAHVS